MRSSPGYPTTLSWALLFVALSSGAMGAVSEGAASVGLTASEQAWLDAHDRTLRVGTDMSYWPYAFIEDGRFSGLAADYIAILADRLDVRIEVRIYASFADLIAAGQAREVDLLPFLVDAPGRRAFLQFSDPSSRCMITS